MERVVFYVIRKKGKENIRKNETETQKEKPEDAPCNTEAQRNGVSADERLIQFGWSRRITTLPHMTSEYEKLVLPRNSP